MVEQALANVNTLSQNFEISEKVAFLHGLQDQGAHIFPLRPLRFLPDGRLACSCQLGEACPQLGKHPYTRWGSPLDPGEAQTRRVVSFVCDRDPTRGFGLHAGLSGLCVLDIDPKNGGEASFDAFCESLGIQLGHPTVWTGSGGRHYYFLSPANADQRLGFVGRNGVARCSLQLAPGLEIFFGQHFVVLPYSLHKSGRFYRGDAGGSPGPLPDAILDLVHNQAVFQVKPSPATVAFSTPSATGGPAGHAPIDLARAYVNKIPGAIDGDGGSRVTSYVARLLVIDFGLARGDARQVFAEWNATCSPPWGPEEIERKLDWAEAGSGPRGTKGQRYERRDEDFQVTWKKGDDGKLTIIFGGKEYDPQVKADDLSADREKDHRQGNESEDSASRAHEQGPQRREEMEVREPQTVRCNCCIRVLQRTENFEKARISCVPTRRLDCPVHGPQVRNHHKATVTHHLEEWRKAHDPGRDPVLYVCRVSVEGFDRLRKRIKYRGGKFFAIDSNGLGNIAGDLWLVVSTCGDRRIDSERVSVDEAIRRMHEAIDRIPAARRGKWWRRSKGWELLKDRERKPPEFKNLKRLPWPLKTLLAILEAWCGTPKRIRCDGRFYSMRAYQVAVPPGKWADIETDLEIGQYTGGITITWGNRGGGVHTAESAEAQFLNST